MSRQQHRIAILGCGAVTRVVHLPALDRNGIQASLLIDKDLGRAETLAEQFNVPQVSDDYIAYMGEFDAAILALPHHLHAVIGVDLLKQGVHVLVEKPLAMTSAECQDMILAAQSSGAVLTVGLTRRFLDTSIWLKGALDAGVLGEIQSFDIQEGLVYSWPVVTDFMFRREMGGGVLNDTGAHTIDLLLWWLGNVANFDYWDDDFGGVEADCEMRLTLESGAQGFVALSRTRNLRNTAIIRGTKGEIEISLFGSFIRANPASLLDFKYEGAVGNKLNAKNRKKVADRQHLDWLDAIENRRQPMVPAEQGARSIELIEKLRSMRRALIFPWSASEAGEGLGEKGASYVAVR